MTPDKRPKHGTKKKQVVSKKEVASRTKPSSDDTHQIVFFKRHKDDDQARGTPARDFLNDACPPGVRLKLQNILVLVAKTPPKKFDGGGVWEAMHDDLTGWFEAKADGPRRTHYRLNCRIDLDAIGATAPLLVVVTGMKKMFMTKLSPSDYAKVRALGDEYFSHNPRSLE